LVCSETLDIQGSLVAAVEKLVSVEFTTLVNPDVTELCA